MSLDARVPLGGFVEVAFNLNPAQAAIFLQHVDQLALVIDIGQAETGNLGDQIVSINDDRHAPIVPTFGLCYDVDWQTVLQ
jgi:hypothetical protein